MRPAGNPVNQLVATSLYGISIAVSFSSVIVALGGEIGEKAVPTVPLMVTSSTVAEGAPPPAPVMSHFASGLAVTVIGWVLVK